MDKQVAHMEAMISESRNHRQAETSESPSFSPPLGVRNAFLISKNPTCIVPALYRDASIYVPMDYGSA